MAKKYIIFDSSIRAAAAITNHFELVSDGDNHKVEGGGWWEWDREKKEILLYRLSVDFGPVKKERLLEVLKSGNVPRWFLGAKIYFAEYNYSLEEAQDKKELLICL